MTAERLEIIAASGKILNQITLTPVGKERIMVEGDFLSNGLYLTSMDKLKSILRLRAKLKYGKGFELRYSNQKSYSKI